MHIPASMLHGSICPVTAAVSAVGVLAAGALAWRSEDRPTSSRFAAVTALIFALQMLNYPIQDGTSGHLVGAVLAVGLLGIPFAVLSMTMILVVQAVFFGDGGINALGANILNMSLLGAGLAGVLLQRLTRAGLPRRLSIAAAAWFSVVIGALACALEAALAGTAGWTGMLTAMLSLHALIGVGEALLTVALLAGLEFHGRLWQEREGAFSLGAILLACVAALCSPLASGLPDGLERVLGDLSLAPVSGAHLPVLFPDYMVPAIPNATLATITAGLLGIGILLAVSFSLRAASGLSRR
ncbi:MAG: cobalamin biosynthesis protein CbiM [Deltaproteobacteria bacterium HGW-Deltaproteobacteria-22]|jgi:cobalt/nickel transport system permease protein|nr:MAG: cobalamin biosynthesis protein CbiM [Deltaproteobacteria bacterium HGW-Deltaproteobacteria-22]